jgi:hypothetical protein
MAPNTKGTISLKKRSFKNELPFEFNAIQVPMPEMKKIRYSRQV